MNTTEKKLLCYIKEQEKSYKLLVDKHKNNVPSNQKTTDIKKLNPLIYLKTEIDRINNYDLIKKLFAIMKCEIDKYTRCSTSYPIHYFIINNYEMLKTEISMLFYKYHPYKYLEWHHNDILDKTDKFICKNHLITPKKLKKFIIKSLKIKSLKEKQNVLDRIAKLLFDADIIGANFKDLCYNLKDSEQFTRYMKKFILFYKETDNVKKISDHLNTKYETILICDNIISKLGTIPNGYKVNWKAIKKNDKQEWIPEYI